MRICMCTMKEKRHVSILFSVVKIKMYRNTYLKLHFEISKKKKVVKRGISDNVCN